jgi:hypothetical protein
MPTKKGKSGKIPSNCGLAVNEVTVSLKLTVT